MTEDHPSQSRHLEREIILLCVPWYLRRFVSYSNLEEMIIEWELTVDHSTINRRFQSYGSELKK